MGLIARLMIPFLLRVTVVLILTLLAWLVRALLTTVGFVLAEAFRIYRRGSSERALYWILAVFILTVAVAFLTASAWPAFYGFAVWFLTIEAMDLLRVSDTEVAEPSIPHPLYLLAARLGVIRDAQTARRR